jgi:hypothetical protein
MTGGGASFRARLKSARPGEPACQRVYTFVDGERHPTGNCGAVMLLNGVTNLREVMSSEFCRGVHASAGVSAVHQPSRMVADLIFSRLWLKSVAAPWSPGKEVLCDARSFDL